MNLIIAPTQKKTAPIKSQQTFNRLIKQVENLQKSIFEQESALDECLHYYNSNVYPAEKKMVEKLIECIPIFYSFHKNPKVKLSKFEREGLKELIQSLLSNVLCYLPPYKLNSELREIIEDIEKIDFEKELSQGFAIIKEDALCFYAEQGIDIDLSQINENDSSEEFFSKIADAVHKGMQDKNIEEEFKEKETTDKKKTSKQIEKEVKARQLLETQQKGLSTIYKQLAKAFHPDLEYDMSVKIEKEALMKKLTHAYENNDLYSLLSLEIEWMNRSNQSTNKNEIRTETQLKTYNTILKEQIKALKEELNSIFNQPKYFSIKSIVEQGPGDSFMEAIKDKEHQLSLDIKRYSAATVDLQQKNGLTNLKKILKAFSTPSFEEQLILILDECFE